MTKQFESWKDFLAEWGDRVNNGLNLLVQLEICPEFNMITVYIAQIRKGRLMHINVVNMDDQFEGARLWFKDYARRPKVVEG